MLYVNYITIELKKRAERGQAGVNGEASLVRERIAMADGKASPGLCMEHSYSLDPSPRPCPQCHGEHRHSL